MFASLLTSDGGSQPSDLVRLPKRGCLFRSLDLRPLLRPRRRSRLFLTRWPWCLSSIRAWARRSPSRPLVIAIPVALARGSMFRSTPSTTVSGSSALTSVICIVNKPLTQRFSARPWSIRRRTRGQERSALSVHDRDVAHVGWVVPFSVHGWFPKSSLWSKLPDPREPCPQASPRQWLAVGLFCPVTASSHRTLRGWDQRSTPASLFTADCTLQSDLFHPVARLRLCLARHASPLMGNSDFVHSRSNHDISHPTQREQRLFRHADGASGSIRTGDAWRICGKLSVW